MKAFIINALGIIGASGSLIAMLWRNIELITTSEMVGAIAVFAGLLAIAYLLNRVH